MEEDEDIIEVLHSLKESIVIDGELTKDYDQSIQQIYNLINEDLDLIKHLDRWNFIERQLLYVLRQSNSFRIGLEFLTVMLEYNELRVPKYFYGRKFVFFITDKLYSSLHDPTSIIIFVRKLIEKDHVFVYVFYECGFFVLLNSCIEPETIKLYSIIFRNIVEIGLNSHIEPVDETIRRKDNDICKSTPADIMFEVQRKLFDNEIIFKDSNILNYKLRKYFFRTANSKEIEIFNDLLSTNIYNLIDVCLDDDISYIVDILKFKYFNYVFLLDNIGFLNLCYEGNLMSIRMVRLMIENVEDKLLLLKLEQNNYFKKVFKLLDQKNVSLRLEVALSLFSYLECINHLVDVTFIDEPKIRKIVGLLEYRCIECNCLYKKCSRGTDEGSSSYIEDNEAIASDSIATKNIEPVPVNVFEAIPVQALNEESKHDIFNPSIIKTDVSDFEILTDISNLKRDEVYINKSCLKKCRTLQIALSLLKLYKTLRKEYFYKISYLMIFKNLYDALRGHNCFDKSHFLVYFEGFLIFLRKDRYNFSRLLFPFRVKKEKANNDHKTDNCKEDSAIELDSNEIISLGEKV